MARKKKGRKGGPLTDIARSIERRGTKGALRAAAKRAGALNKDGTIKVSWLREKAKKRDLLGRRAHMALVFRKHRKKR